MLHLFGDDGQPVGQLLTTNIADFLSHGYFVSIRRGKIFGAPKCLIYCDTHERRTRDNFSIIESVT